ncbi:UNVERIFIED_CONTAM: hypothetical protein Sradi_6898900 [Sesamum radiatum]|uniref:Uncharacterized protein n=1 Tax=Sesamum radiatum TaxID=300843 RepID=A0AAW2JI56_SESRA
MEENSLLPLSHISHTTLSHNTPRTHTTPETHTHNPNHAAADGDVSGAVPPPNGDDQTCDAPSGLNPTDFNLGEFLALANRVVDVGDVESVAALADLKRRWVENLGMEG